MSDVLEHAGVKGMKWGVRKKVDGGGQNDGVLKKKVGDLKLKVKAHVGSIKREHNWKKVAGDISKLSTKDINKLSNRIGMENELKRLSKDSAVGSKKVKQDYLNRGKMKDQELARKVTRLRAQVNLHKQINQASKAQRDMGKKIVNTAGPLVVKSALGMKISVGDINKAMSGKGNLKEDLSKLAGDYVNETLKKKYQ